MIMGSMDLNDTIEICKKNNIKTVGAGLDHSQNLRAINH